MKALVAGAERVDAGKTTFSTGLVSRLSATGFKPRAGNDYWFHHGDFRRAVDDGRLYGKDARRLAAASAGDPRPEDINPIHRLWRPAPDGDRFIGSADKTFVLDRAGETYVVNANADVPPSARDALPLDGAVHVATVDELNAVTGERYLPLLGRLEERVDQAGDAVVESYGDVARPLQEVEFDAVAVVEPERARVYDGARYRHACEVTSASPLGGRLEERVGDVVDLIDPEATVRLPALPDDVRTDPDRVARAYDKAYDALVAAGEASG